MAEASGGRTHRQQENLPPAGFEDRDDHRTACASAGSLNATTKARLQIFPDGCGLSTNSVFDEVAGRDPQSFLVSRALWLPAAEIPVRDFQVFAACGALLGVGLSYWCRSDHGIPRPPVRWSRAFALIRDLQSFSHPQQLVDIATAGHWVVEDGANVLLGINKEARSYRRRIADCLVHHAVSHGDFLVEVSDHRKRYLQLEMFLDVTHPRNVRIDAIH